MKNPFNDMGAFSPFFDTPVSVSGERARPQGGVTRIAGTYTACVFDNGFAGPFSEADVDSSVRTFSIQVRAGDWLERKPPQVGDRISIANVTPCDPELPSVSLAVSTIDSLFGDIWIFTAKEIH